MTPEVLTQLAGRPVQGAYSGSEGGAVDCDTTSDDLGIAIYWRTRPDAGSLDEEVARAHAAAPGLVRSPIVVAGHRGVLFGGEVAGQRVARIVTVIGTRALSVRVGHLDGVGADATSSTLQDLARAVAGYAASAMS